MRQEGNKIYADEGMVLKHKPNGPVFGTEVDLGLKKLPDGSLVPDTIDDFEEIEDTQRDFDINIENNE